VKPYEPTLEERAADALNRLSSTMPTQTEVISGAPLPEWITAKWLPALTDPANKKFAKAVVEAEAWLAAH
jgi:hypothetical protein